MSSMTWWFRSLRNFEGTERYDTYINNKTHWSVDRKVGADGCSSYAHSTDGDAPTVDSMHLHG